MNIRHACYALGLLLTSCRPTPPATSSITINMRRPATPVNGALYGLTVEDVNHAVEGGLYAELIRNRGFEDGIVPDDCLYDASGNCLVTPSGWNIPFVPPGAVPGWHALSERTSIALDAGNPVNEASRHSLRVYVSRYDRAGGVAAEGFRGIGLRRGERYDLSMYVRGKNLAALTVGLRDSTAGRQVSDTCRVPLSFQWTKIHHTFTATADIPDAQLVFSADTGVWFNLDIVSLFPEKTWKNRPNGLRPDLMEALHALQPKFVRFPGGPSAEGYAFGATPSWEATTLPLELRKPSWNIRGYGLTNGMGFHEYLQMCEDLEAQPVYVTGAGLLNQRYRLRYEPMEQMDARAQSLVDAIAYANAPTDSVHGRMRAANGHPAPFGLQTVEIGSENRGSAYVRRYSYLRDAVRKAHPGISIICCDTTVAGGLMGSWTDTHYTMNTHALISNHNRFNVTSISLRTLLHFVGEFSAAHAPEGGTIRAAVGEAAFLIGVERNPKTVKGVAYSPMLGHAAFPPPDGSVPAIRFDALRIAKSPSWYMLQMFAGNRGDELLETNVRTYHKPLVTPGRASVECHRDQFEVENLHLDGEHIAKPFVHGNPAAPNRPAGTTRPAPADERPQHVMLGDSAAYNYTFSAKIKQTQAGGRIHLRVRDNGLKGERCDHLALTLAEGTARLHHRAGRVERTLAPPAPLPLEKDRWYTVRIVCENEQIRCYVDNTLLTEATVHSLPSLLAVATRETETNTLILKVVNTTFHDEWTSLHIDGGSTGGKAKIIRLTGPQNHMNTLDNPEAIVPVQKDISFSGRKPVKHAFPANSITIIRMKLIN
jgi:alpha-L-arabinofuranosidase